MNLVLPFNERDLPQVLRLLAWSAELSGRQTGHTLFLMPFKGLDATEALAMAGRAFSDVRTIPDAEGVISDWQDDGKVRDAAGPNSMFRQVAWHFYLNPDLPWFFWEPDCIPIEPDWARMLLAEYLDSGKLFMGVSMKMPGGSDTYMNGAGIYPAKAAALSPAVVTRTTWTQAQDREVAFDVAGGKELARQAHFTTSILIEYRHAPFENLDAIIPGTLLFHGDRTGSLIPLLRAKARGGAVVARRAHIPKAEGSIPSPETAAPVAPQSIDWRATTSKVRIARELRAEIERHCVALRDLAGRSGHRRQLIHQHLRKLRLIQR